MSETPLRDKALALISEARRVSDSRESEAEARRVDTALADLIKDLDELTTVLDAARLLNSRGAAIPLDKLDGGLAMFINRSGHGLPSSQAVQGARKSVKSVRTAVGTPLIEAWQQWSNSRLSELRTERLEMLGDEQAIVARAAVDQLRKFARQPPTATVIQQFLATHAGVRVELDEAPEPDPEVIELLTRLRAGTTLDKLSDADIALLREKQLDSTIEIRRRNA
jgi:hypothetical protein